MKKSFPAFLNSLVVGAMLVPAVTFAANPPQIVRIPKVPAAAIVDAIALPVGAETLVLSGQTPSPLDPKKIDGPNDFGDMRTQAKSVFGKIKSILEKQGYSMNDVISLTVFLVGDPKLGGRADFAGMDEIYATHFGTVANPNLPTRSTMQVASLRRAGYHIEVEAVAARIPSK